MLIVTILVSAIFVLSLAFCLVRIVLSIFAESKYKAVLSQNAPYSTVTGEPFTGALYLCALLVYIYGSAYDAEHEMKYSFRKVMGRCDWGPYCRAAESLHSSLNGDLLVESFASMVSKNKLDKEFLICVFDALSSAEIVWDQKQRGTKPSVYLARLLDYSLEDDELTAAYKTLGLKRNATLAEVKSAHRRLAAKYHPDNTINHLPGLAGKKTSSSASAADELEVFIKIQKAYECIIASK